MGFEKAFGHTWPIFFWVLLSNFNRIGDVYSFTSASDLLYCYRYEIKVINIHVCITL
ncbi:hypothetical protein CYPRO_1986 [Cyclonatronum proteinivorum]|uniref:Uncharacterized protein n=1 Tax=Cyclonatronum proteinivorum TaxID=1457365 RepID=A0A345UL84_9BACT|nr:hypothetical protein CYPRO_1986 [Cyclonatronum proteinivorum]